MAPKKNLVWRCACVAVHMCVLLVGGGWCVVRGGVCAWGLTHVRPVMRGFFIQIPVLTTPGWKLLT